MVFPDHRGALLKLINFYWATMFVKTLNLRDVVKAKSFSFLLQLILILFHFRDWVNNWGLILSKFDLIRLRLANWLQSLINWLFKVLWDDRFLKSFVILRHLLFDLNLTLLPVGNLPPWLNFFQVCLRLQNWPSRRVTL